MTCAAELRIERQNKNNAVEKRRQRVLVIRTFIGLRGSCVGFWFLLPTKLFAYQRWTPPPDSPGAGATQSVLSLCSGFLFQAAGKHTQSFVNCQPITWPRFRTSPASAGRLDCLHPLQKKAPGGSYRLLKKNFGDGLGDHRAPLSPQKQGWKAGISSFARRWRNRLTPRGGETISQVTDAELRRMAARMPA